MASHPSPFHRHRQSNKTLDPTGQTAKFLYTILKQLDLKNIDWNEVASSLDITNGHAARMRWSRFRAQIEGLDNSYSRKGGKKKEGEKKRKKDDKDMERVKKEARGQETTEAKKPKLEAGIGYEVEGWLAGRHENNDQVSTGFKKETSARVSVIDGVNIHHPTVTTITVPQSNGSNIAHSQGSSGMGIYLSAGIHPTYVDRSIADQKPQQPHGPSSTSYVPYRWPQPYHNVGYPQHSYRSNTTPSSYSPTPYYHANQHQYTSTYANQPQYRYVHGQPLMSGQLQQQQPYKYPLVKPQITNSVAGSGNGSIVLETQMQNQSPVSRPLMNSSSATNTAATHNKSQPSVNVPDISTDQLQEQACELASQISYPWSYNEASLSQFVSQLNNPIDLVTSTNEQQTKSRVLNDGEHQQASNSCCDVDLPCPIHRDHSNSSSSGQAFMAHLEDNTDSGEVEKPKQESDLAATGKAACPLEQTEDHIHVVAGIKVEPVV